MRHLSKLGAGGALLVLAWASSILPSLAADPRIADIVQDGKIRAALFLPQYTKDPATGELRGKGTGLFGIEIARLLAGRIGVGAELVGYPTPADATALVPAVMLRAVTPPLSAPQVSRC